MKLEKLRKYKAIGLMSGTSLDGLDIAFCKFHYKRKKWQFSIEAAQTVTYSLSWKKRLASAHLQTGEQLMQLHAEYGRFLGQACAQFIKQKKLKRIDLIASHGHTIFHQPENKFTFQLGDGNAIHAKTELPVVLDFRSLDVALEGEGAPLVPIGDQLLFSDFDGCLNLGGIANLWMDVKGKRKAFDICFCNMLLNYLAEKAGQNFDRGGKLAQKGSVNKTLLLSFEKCYGSFRKKRPSLGREGFEKQFQRLLDTKSIPLNDRLRTACESIADEITRSVPAASRKIKLMVTGGGALNGFLIDLIDRKLRTSAKVIIPSEAIVNFKEALVFAFLGVLRVRHEKNVLRSVTGASRNSCSGILIG